MSIFSAKGYTFTEVETRNVHYISQIWDMKKLMKQLNSERQKKMSCHNELKSYSLKSFIVQ